MTDRQAGNPAPTELETALAAMTAAQCYVQQADAKVNTLLVLHTGGTVAVLGVLGGASGRAVVVWVLLALFAAAFLVSGYHALQALRPRLDSPALPNRFGMAGPRPEGAVDPQAWAEEAWELSRLLSRIALLKNRHLAKATPWAGAMISCAVFAALVRR
ncbi:hypothetical protein ACWEPB_19585 [Kitasatospora cineracea]